MSWIEIQADGSAKAHLSVCAVSSAVTEKETVRVSAAPGTNGKTRIESPMLMQCFELNSNRPKRALWEAKDEVLGGLSATRKLFGCAFIGQPDFRRPARVQPVGLPSTEPLLGQHYLAVPALL